MPQHFVCLTFDHDNASSMISRKLTTPTMISRGDFGIVATERILALMKAKRITTTWFIPGHTIETYPNCTRNVFEAGHEISDPHVMRPVHRRLITQGALDGPLRCEAGEHQLGHAQCDAETDECHQELRNHDFPTDIAQRGEASVRATDSRKRASFPREIAMARGSRTSKPH